MFLDKILTDSTIDQLYKHMYSVFENYPGIIYKNENEVRIKFFGYPSHACFIHNSGCNEKNKRQLATLVSEIIHTSPSWLKYDSNNPLEIFRERYEQYDSFLREIVRNYCNNPKVLVLHSDSKVQLYWKEENLAFNLYARLLQSKEWVIHEVKKFNIKGD